MGLRNLFFPRRRLSLSLRLSHLTQSANPVLYWVTVFLRPPCRVTPR
eukprot:COSAG06_NODE_62247_length_265_cov_1.174699_1_plen_46_part_10